MSPRSRQELETELQQREVTSDTWEGVVHELLDQLDLVEVTVNTTTNQIEGFDDL